MPRTARYILIVTAVFICMGMLLLAWSFHADQQQFRAAKNDCERGCIQDSGVWTSVARFAWVIQAAIREVAFGV